MQERICAVVVTYNRKAVLQECLEALLSQTRPANQIMVIDNASIDGTAGMVANKFGSLKRIVYFNLGKNLGGAGGFHHGARYAFSAGFDWIWLMDDDCLPTQDCLSILIDNIGDRGNLYSPVVLSLEDRKTVLWGLKVGVRTGNHEVRSIPFNGLLVHRNLIEEIGLPEKNFFIYGDDTEYNLRAKSLGKHTTMVTDSIMYHPHKNMMKGFKVYKIFLNHLWAYYKLRNALILYKRYRHVAHKQVILLFAALGLYVLTLNIGFVRLWLEGLRDGLRGKLTIRGFER